jgi:hypothetical protein
VTLLFSLNASAQNVDIKDYVDARVDANRQHADAQFRNIQENITKATASLDKRLDGMNEFRDTLKDQAGTFITRGELFAWIIGIAGLFFGYSAYASKRKNL